MRCLAHFCLVCRLCCWDLLQKFFRFDVLLKLSKSRHQSSGRGISREALWGDGKCLARSRLHIRKSHQAGSARLKQDSQSKILELGK